MDPPDTPDQFEFSIKGSLGKRKSVPSAGETSPNRIHPKPPSAIPSKVRFDSEASTNSGASFLNPRPNAGMEMKPRRASMMKSVVGAFKAKDSGSEKKGDDDRRLSMWGEQLHDKLFAKRDVKEVMRGKLKLNLKDEANNSPQIYQTDISNVVDYDEEDKENMVKRSFNTDFIESTWFRSFILIMIVINSVFIALQTDKEMERKWGFMFSAADQLILTIFICEILLKWYGGFFTYWKVGWNIFDFIIVASSLIGPSFTFVSSSRVLRILRVLRAFRSLRSISALRPLQLVVQTIIQSLPDMANILLLLVIFMFVFAVIGVSFFSTYSPEYFGSLETAMFSLFICITLDGWIEIFNTLRDTQFALASIYFVIFILIGAFILINLVVAVVVTNLESAIAEQDELDLQQMQEEKGNQDDKDELHTYDLRNVLIKKFWKHQKPIEVPNLPALNPHKVQNYMILVTALEDNYSEMLFLNEELNKIAKEVWEWNSPVDEEAEVPLTTPIIKPPVHIRADDAELTPTPKDTKRQSALAHLLTKASLASSTESSRRAAPKTSIKRKSTISSQGYRPLTTLREEGQESLTTITSFIANEEEAGESSRSRKESINDSTMPEDEDSLIAPAISDLYSSTMNLKRSHSAVQNSKMAAIRERKASLIEDIEKRETRGDVLSDLIKMNKKTNNFSGKSQNMSQFVHGVDWLRSKVKSSGGDPGERKKKWQVEAEAEQAKRVASSQPEYSGNRASLTSNNLISNQLSYAMSTVKGTALDPNSQGELVRTVSDIRRNSIADIKRDIQELYSSDLSSTTGSASESVTIPMILVPGSLSPDTPSKTPPGAPEDTTLQIQDSSDSMLPEGKLPSVEGE